MRPKCEKCEKESALTVQASGHFCRDCFIDYFRQKFRRILGNQFKKDLLTTC